MPSPEAKVQAELRLSTDGEAWATPRRMALLAAVAQHGSLTRAAAAAGFSYKGAWDAISALQRGAGESLLLRVIGGRGGGSSVLTARGEALLARYALMSDLQNGFMSHLDKAAEPLEMLRSLRLATSAQNQFYGLVERIDEGAVHTEVALRLDEGALVYAMLARDSARELKLELGMACFALVQSQSLLLLRGDAALSARNQLAARVEQIERGAVNAQVRLGLIGSASRMTATLSMAALVAMKLRTGARLSVAFEGSAVILGTFHAE
jgi:molybdate transport system regulatory protein